MSNQPLGTVAVLLILPRLKEPPYSSESKEQTDRSESILVCSDAYVVCLSSPNDRSPLPRVG